MAKIIVLAAVAVLYLSACATLGDAAREAATDRGTWVPLVGAAALSIGDLDREASDWALRHNPIFGSQDNAEDASDVLVGSLVLTALGTAVLAPEDAADGPGKSARIAANLIALVAGDRIPDALKPITGRDRPNGVDDRSLPSGHSMTAFSASRMTSANLRAFDLEESTRWWLDAGLTAMAAGTAWARVEAAQHYPVDVLAGAALGNFIAVFTTEAFGLNRHRVQVSATGDGILLTVHWAP